MARIAAAMAGRCGASSRLADGVFRPLLAGLNTPAKGSGAIQARCQTHGKHASVSSHDQGNQYFGLGEGRHDLI